MLLQAVLVQLPGEPELLRGQRGLQLRLLQSLAIPSPVLHLQLRSQCQCQCRAARGACCCARCGSGSIRRWMRKTATPMALRRRAMQRAMTALRPFLVQGRRAQLRRRSLLPQGSRQLHPLLPQGSHPRCAKSTGEVGGRRRCGLRFP